MFSKVNIWGIVKNHFKTLIDDSTGEYRLWDFVLFIGVPIGIASILIFHFQLLLGGNLTNLLATSLSIVTALLFNLLVLIFDISGKNKARFAEKKRITDFLKQIYVNISFSIVVSILAVITVIVSDLGIWPQVVLAGLSFATYFLVVLFLLTLLMVLKRIDVLLFEDFKDYD